MSKRWVTRDEYADAAAAVTDPDRLIHRFLPQLRAHVITKYRWMSERGNCVLDVDDLIQLACIVLMSLADRWASIVEDHPEFKVGPDGTYDGIFYNYLKVETKSRLGHAHRDERRAAFEGLTFEIDGEEFERPRLYEVSDGEMHDRTGVRRRPDGPWWPAIVNNIMCHWDTMPTKEKVGIALRAFDGLSPKNAAELAGCSQDVLIRAVNRWRTHARNQVVLGDPHDVPRRSYQHAWEPPELLIMYLRDRHRMDLYEYLGIVTISFRTDPDYISEILDVKQRPIQRAQITDQQIATLDRMAAQGYNYSQIARAVGIAPGSVANRLNPDRAARLRHRNRARALG